MQFTVGDYFIILRSLRDTYDKLTNTHVAYRNDNELIALENLIKRIENSEV